MPTEEEHLASCEASGGDENCDYWVDYTSSEMTEPLIDANAAGIYVMLGILFVGLSVLASTFAIIGFRNGSPGLLRAGAIIVFFTQGHYYSACFLGMICFALSFSLPKRD